MWLEKLLKICGDLSGWITPERREKAWREKREIIKKDLRKIKRRVWTTQLAKKVEKLEKQLKKLNLRLGS